jgi:hypothetical protein
MEYTDTSSRASRLFGWPVILASYGLRAIVWAISVWVVFGYWGWIGVAVALLSGALPFLGPATVAAVTLLMQGRGKEGMLLLAADVACWAIRYGGTLIVTRSERRSPAPRGESPMERPRGPPEGRPPRLPSLKSQPRPHSD